MKIITKQAPTEKQVVVKAQAKAWEGNEVPSITHLWIRTEPDDYTPLHV
ncbi:hypothetical protein [Paenibacillus polymyxa]|nr:hypothetical protein [Paenibacillus polymyxa]KAF6625492.1 hypothetical protein HFE01_24625 [Paenibacillus sp. EKM10P]